MDAVLNEDWTADVVRQMHKYRITNIQLAAACDTPREGYSAAYLSTVLNGRKVFENEEAKQRTKETILAALTKLVTEAQSSSVDPDND